MKTKLKSRKMWLRTSAAGVLGGGLNALINYLDTPNAELTLHALKRTFVVAAGTTALSLLIKSPLFQANDNEPAS